MAAATGAGCARPPDPETGTAPGGNRGGGENRIAGEPSWSSNSPRSPAAQTQFSAALHRWAARRGERLAEEYLRQADRGGAAEFFAAEIAREKLLLQLRQTAETAFLARVATAERAP